MKKSKKIWFILLGAFLCVACVLGSFDLGRGFVKSVCEKTLRNMGVGYDNVNIKNYSSDAIDIPGLSENFIPQGVCFVEELDLYAVSGYVKGEESRIYLVSKDNKWCKKLYLKDYKEHAGGIASNKKDLWVSSGGNEEKGGKIYHISTDVLKNAKDGDSVSFDGSFEVFSRASALYANDEMLFVAEFYEYKDYPVNKAHYFQKNHAIASGYKLPLTVDYSSNQRPVPDVVLSIPDKVQGMAITDSKNVIFSTSYGRKNDSVLYTYADLEKWEKASVTLDEREVPLYIANKESFVSKVKMPTLMEGLDCYDGSLYVIFESGAKNYSNAKEIISTVWKTDIEKALMEK